MIIVIGGIKGGSGKTTIAINLAVMRSKISDLLLVDADDQETASDFTVLRNEKLGRAGYTSIKLNGSAVRTETLKLSQKYKDIIIDTGGRDTTSQRAALTIANIFIVPFVPRSFDIWTIEKVVNVIKEIKIVNPALKVLTFINRSDSKGHDNHEAAEILKENEELLFLDTPIGQRKAFGNAAGLGLSVTELKTKDAYANSEINALYSAVFDISLI